MAMFLVSCSSMLTASRNCGYCGATGLVWYPCPHQKSLGMQAALSAAPQDGSSYGRKKSSKGGGSSKGHASVLSA